MYTSKSQYIKHKLSYIRESSGKWKNQHYYHIPRSVMRFTGASVDIKENGSNEAKARYAPNAVHIQVQFVIFM